MEAEPTQTDAPAKRAKPRYMSRVYSSDGSIRVFEFATKEAIDSWVQNLSSEVAKLFVPGSFPELLLTVNVGSMIRGVRAVRQLIEHTEERIGELEDLPGDRAAALELNSLKVRAACLYIARWAARSMLRPAENEQRSGLPLSTIRIRGGWGRVWPRLQAARLTRRHLLAFGQHMLSYLADRGPSVEVDLLIRHHLTQITPEKPLAS